MGRVTRAGLYNCRAFSALLRLLVRMNLCGDWRLIQQLQCRPWGRSVGITPVLKEAKVSTLQGGGSSSLSTCIVLCQTGCEFSERYVTPSALPSSACVEPFLFVM